MMRRTKLATLALALLLAAAPAVAETLFHVELANGEEFKTFYSPQEASWDSDTILFLNDVGNWMAVPRDQVVEVRSDTEVKGFGKVIDSTTIEIGYLLNDEPTPEELEEQGGSAATAQDALLPFLRSEPQPDYTVQQFVNPEDASGIPLSYGVGGAYNVP